MPMGLTQPSQDVKQAANLNSESEGMHACSSKTISSKISICLPHGEASIQVHGNLKFVLPSLGTVQL